jgi:hypothetical protein
MKTMSAPYMAMVNARRSGLAQTATPFVRLAGHTRIARPAWQDRGANTAPSALAMIVASRREALAALSLQALLTPIRGRKPT